MVSLTATAGGAAIARPRFPNPLSTETLERIIVDSAWKSELPPEVRPRTASIANQVLLHFLERWAEGSVRLELAVGARELLVEFAVTAPGALDDGASAKVWAGAIAATLLAVQWSDIPRLDLIGPPLPLYPETSNRKAREDVAFDRGLDDDLFADDEDDDDDLNPLDRFTSAAGPKLLEWEEINRDCAIEMSASLRTLVCEISERARVVQSTLSIRASDRRWLVPHYRTVVGQPGVIRSRMKLNPGF